MSIADQVVSQRRTSFTTSRRLGGRTLVVKILEGAEAGLVGTLAMTVVLVAGRAAQLLWVPPPVQITHRAERKTGLLHELTPGTFQASWALAHLGYGSAAGGGYALLRPILPASPRASGLLFGLALWAVSYLGLMPALGLYPWPTDDSKTRQATMIVAHLVYGLVTGQTYRLRGDV